MHEEELLSSAHEDEEPVLKERYIPSFELGKRGEYALVIVGKTSRNPFPGERFKKTEAGRANTRLKILHELWEKNQLEKKLKNEEARAKKPV